MADDLKLDPATTALVLIDLQAGIVGRQTAPHSASDIVAKAAAVAEKFRAVGGTVCLVNVSFSEDGGNRVKQPTDAPMGEFPPGWDVLVPEIGRGPNDVTITKHNWNAFYGTALDLELRRRSVTTIVLGGISTNFGVDSTARAAYEQNYAVVFVEDMMASHVAEGHEFAIKTIFPRLGRVRFTEQVLAVLG